MFQHAGTIVTRLTELQGYRGSIRAASSQEDKEQALHDLVNGNSFMFEHGNDWTDGTSAFLDWEILGTLLCVEFGLW